MVLLFIILSGSAAMAKNSYFGINVGTTLYTRDGNSPGFYAFFRGIGDKPDHLVGFAIDVHTLSNHTYYRKTNGSAFSLNFAIAPKIKVERSYFYIGPVAGVAILSYSAADMFGKGSKSGPSLTFGAQAGANIFLTNTLMWNFEISPRWLSRSRNFMANFPDAYVPLSTGLRFQLP